MRYSLTPHVARQAGLSRPTVYRRWPDVHAVVSALLIRQMQHIQLATALDGYLRPC
jgi:AcrR family transcriptional regulator